METLTVLLQGSNTNAGKCVHDCFFFPFLMLNWLCNMKVWRGEWDQEMAKGQDTNSDHPKLYHTTCQNGAQKSMALSFAGFWKRKWWAVGLELDWHSSFGLTVSSSLATFIHNQGLTESVALQIYKELEFYIPPKSCVFVKMIFLVLLYSCVTGSSTLRQNVLLF